MSSLLFTILLACLGHLILGFAAAYGYAPVDELWNKSRLDELWQEEQWGPDEEAQALSDVKKAAVLACKAVFRRFTDCLTQGQHQRFRLNLGS